MTNSGAGASTPPRSSGLALLTGTKSGRLITILLVLKGLVLIFNTATYSPHRGYDAGHHAWRARSAGLEMDKLAYNSPFYYLPALPWVDLSRFYDHGKPRLNVPAEPDEVGANYRGGGGRTDYTLLGLLQGLNVVYVLGAYLAWIVGILPLVARSRRTWFLASLLVLALPGFEKAAVMAHPDVLLIFMSSVTFLLTIRWLNRHPTRFTRNIALAVLAGLTGACRPFAVVPLLILWVLNIGMLIRDAIASARSGASSRMATISRLCAKVAVVSLIAVALSSSWWVFRYAHTGEVLNAYQDGYIVRFAPLKEDYDYTHYYTSFYFDQLLEVPNRATFGHRPSLYPKHNSFWTQLYSEFWGDHYLYFSGPKNSVEAKLWVKRVLFVVALPLSFLMWLGTITGTLRAIADAVRRRIFLHPALFMSAIFWGGFLLFLTWQGTAGLLPGKNSTIKFLYIAWLVPFGIGTAASQHIGPRLFWILLVLELAVLIAAFPMSLNIP